MVLSQGTAFALQEVDKSTVYVSETEKTQVIFADIFAPAEAPRFRRPRERLDGDPGTWRTWLR